MSLLYSSSSCLAFCYVSGRFLEVVELSVEVGKSSLHSSIVSWMVLLSVKRVSSLSFTSL